MTEPTTPPPPIAAEGPTPRTDAALRSDTPEKMWVPSDFARQLERELNAERRQYVQCSEALNRALERSSTEQKPIAWLEIEAENNVIGVTLDEDKKATGPLPKGWRWEPLYAAPVSATEQKRPSKWRDGERWRWLFEQNSKNIMVSVKLRQKRDGDMHDSGTAKYGILTLGAGVFPSAMFITVVDSLMAGESLENARTLAAQYLDKSDVDYAPAPYIEPQAGSECGGPDNLCLVAEARGEHNRCQGKCSYAQPTPVSAIVAPVHAVPAATYMNKLWSQCRATETSGEFKGAEWKCHTCGASSGSPECRYAVTETRDRQP